METASTNSLLNTPKLRLVVAVLTSCLSMLMGRAADVPNLPSRQATVILPILSHFSPLDTSKGSVMHEMKRLLGPFDHNDEAGPADHTWRIYSYRLDDGTDIIVEFEEHLGPHSLDLAQIINQCPDGKLKTLYESPGR